MLSLNICKIPSLPKVDIREVASVGAFFLPIENKVAKVNFEQYGKVRSNKSPYLNHVSHVSQTAATKS